MVFACFEECFVIFVAGLVFFDPFTGEFSGLDIFECGGHAAFDGGIYDFGANGDVAPFGGFADGESHA